MCVSVYHVCMYHVFMYYVYLYHVMHTRIMCSCTCVEDAHKVIYTAPLSNNAYIDNALGLDDDNDEQVELTSMSSDSTLRARTSTAASIEQTGEMLHSFALARVCFFPDSCLISQFFLILYAESN